MTDNLFEAKYDITKKSKLRIFYESNKILIIFLLLIFVIGTPSISFYFEAKEKKRTELSEDYIQAKIYLEKGQKDQAKKLLKKNIFANDPTYSTLSFFLILNQELFDNPLEVSEFFDYLLENNKFDKELRNLLIYKKVLFNSDFVDEYKLLEDVKPLLNEKTLWTPHALLLLGDYFATKKEYSKAKDFYLKILSIKGLQENFYNLSKSKIASIDYD